MIHDLVYDGRNTQLSAKETALSITYVLLPKYNLCFTDVKKIKKEQKFSYMSIYKLWKI